MKAEIKIPDGWRRLRSKEKIDYGDRFLSSNQMWEISECIGDEAGKTTIYIRKSKPTPSRKKAP